VQTPAIAFSAVLMAPKWMHRNALVCLLVLPLCTLYTKLPSSDSAFSNSHVASAIVSGTLWPSFLADDEKFEQMASYFGSCPEYPWHFIEKALDKAVRKLYPTAKVFLAGSHQDGTAIHRISDYDVWVDTPEKLSKAQRTGLYEHILRTLGNEFDIRPRDNGIGRKALKFYIGEKGSCYDWINLDVVCLKMMKDVGFDDHDLPLFTRSASRREAQRLAEEHLAQNPEAVYAILAMKAFSWQHGRRIPGYFLNHFARRVQSDPDVPRSSSAVFQEMVVQLLAFCELFDSLQRDLEWASWPLDLDTLESGLNNFRTARRHPYIQSWRAYLIQKSAILLDLWRDLLARDGEIPACHFARTLRRARQRLSDNIRAVSDKDMVHLTSQSPWSKCPASIWSER